MMMSGAVYEIACFKECDATYIKQSGGTFRNILGTWKSSEEAGNL